VVIDDRRKKVSSNNKMKTAEREVNDIRSKLADLPVAEIAASEQYNSSKIIQCPSCPLGSGGAGQLVCGTDNATYSSVCRLEFHNCVHKSVVRFACFGFCPCMRVYEKVQLKPNSVKSSLKTQYYSKKDTEKFLLDKIRVKQKKSNSKINSVLPKNGIKFHYQSPKSAECSHEQLRSMGLRLLDWFLVVMKEELKHQKSEQIAMKKNATQSKKPLKPKSKSWMELPDCEPQASFMFFHFDADQDFKLSLKELYYLEHDENEHCLEPYLTQCDEDRDQYLSGYEWCSCFNLKGKSFDL